ncbi:phenylalanine--tRNA ligase subunit alpha [Acholeplasma equirhinis]|uniref:phenylalanine--tRNA ligase subunit alpha n=1 Tax=Acholeplasma equirhinis TaxID=555393 RepID=UPI00197AD2CD|nr:phenylalanine--tRNA ligase subunit alpha [Acholeplasma equirhinis]MBN3490794.1 phenylalanine--tRNA ligase subunit alpha [Acholeplasma equirhinis]
MKEKIEALVSQLEAEIKDTNSLDQIEAIRVKYLGKSGELTQMMPLIKTLPNEEKPTFGKWINDAKVAMESMITNAKNEVLAKELDFKLAKESIDVTLPGYQFKQASIHPLSLVIEDLEDYFIGQGFNVAEGPELEQDLYNFEMMNLAKGHPAREMHDSFYVTETELMRTHTSPVQARFMLQAAGNPIAIISPGKTYRRDPDDATHSHQFMQCEGLVVGENISFANLKAVLLGMARHLFGEAREIRLRPSYFPFTEPSVEVDVMFTKKDGSKRWIEVLGAGMVHPNVLKMGGYNPEVMNGFAFGIGVERIAILKYGIDDIRNFYTNDRRFLNQFKGE